MRGQMGGENWVRNVLLTGSLFCGPMFITFSFLNTVAIAYRSTAALPFGTICVILIIWALVTFPLTVLGGIAAGPASHPHACLPPPPSHTHSLTYIIRSPYNKPLCTCDSTRVVSSHSKVGAQALQLRRGGQIDIRHGPFNHHSCYIPLKVRKSSS